MRKNTFIPLVVCLSLLGILGVVILKLQPSKELTTRTIYISTCNDNNPEATWTVSLNNAQIGSTASKNTSSDDGKAVFGGTFCERIEYQTQLAKGVLTIQRSSRGNTASATKEVNFSSTPFIYVFPDMNIDAVSKPKQFID